MSNIFEPCSEPAKSSSHVLKKTRPMMQHIEYYWDFVYRN